MPGGIVYLVGAGPGDAGLVTVKGLACIRRADVLVYDRLVSPQLIAEARADAELIYVGKEVGRHGRKQADISRLLAERALQGKAVCRLKGGDPFVFGRGAEEAELLVEMGVPFEVVPGITSGIAAAAYAGISVTHRDVAGSVTFVTGHDAPCKSGPLVDWERLATGSETLLVYMGVERLESTAERLVAAGRPAETPVAVIRWGTTAEQRTVTGTLATIAAEVRQAGITSPAMVVVGEVVGLRARINWAEAKPLFGRRVIVPVAGGGRPDLQALRDGGAEVWEWPVADVADAPSFDWAMAELERCQAVLFASPEAVRRFIARLVPAGRDMRALLSVRVGAADEATAAALAASGLRAEALAAGPGVLLAGAPEETAPFRTAGSREVATHMYRLRTDLAGLLREALPGAELLPATPLAAELLQRLLAEHRAAALVG